MTMNKKPSRPQVNPNTLKRLLGYLSVYKTRVFLVIICILLSAIANVMSSLFIQRLIDDYISPLLLEANPVFDALFRAIVQMAKFMGRRSWSFLPTKRAPSAPARG